MFQENICKSASGHYNNTTKLNDYILFKIQKTTVKVFHTYIPYYEKLENINVRKICKL